MSTKLADGVVHKLPKDLTDMLLSTKKTLEMWDDITPLARNEWICWVDSAKQTETRSRRIRIAKDKLTKGERRPCCWAGCIHREKQSR